MFPECQTYQWGLDCSKTCSTDCPNSCDKITGRCSNDNQNICRTGLYVNNSTSCWLKGTHFTLCLILSHLFSLIKSLKLGPLTSYCFWIWKIFLPKYIYWYPYTLSEYKIYCLSTLLTHLNTSVHYSCQGYQLLISLHRTPLFQVHEASRDRVVYSPESQIGDSDCCVLCKSPSFSQFEKQCGLTFFSSKTKLKVTIFMASHKSCGF